MSAQSAALPGLDAAQAAGLARRLVLQQHLSPKTGSMPRAPSAKAVAAKEAVKKAAVRNAPSKKVAAKRSPAAAPAAQAKPSAAQDSKPSLRFYPEKDLHSRLVALLDQIEESPDATLHRVTLSESVRELTTAGLDYYFVRTLKHAKVGFVTQQSANLGLMGVQQVMAPVIRNIIGRLEHAQLQAIARSIRQMMQS